MPKLFTQAQLARLAANAGLPDGADPRPVVKLFSPDGSATWLLTELHADGMLFGLCDLGLGHPELGYVHRRELETARGRLGLPIERDRHWRATAPLSAYAEAARTAGRIIDRLPDPDPDGAPPAGGAARPSPAEIARLERDADRYGWPPRDPRSRAARRRDGAPFKGMILAGLECALADVRARDGIAPGSEDERAQLAAFREAALAHDPARRGAAAEAAAWGEGFASAPALRLAFGRTVIRVAPTIPAISGLIARLSKLQPDRFADAAGWTLAMDRGADQPQSQPQPEPLPLPAPDPEPWPAPLPAPQPEPWPAPLPAPQPEPWHPTPEDALRARRSEAARKAMANRDRFAAAAKAVATRRARAAAASAPPAPPVPPAFADYVSERLGTRRWIIGPARRGERQLHERVIAPHWHAALRDAYARAFPSVSDA